MVFKYGVNDSSIEPNIVIKYYAKCEDNSNKIRKCKIPFKFGSEGQTNRLFLTGNEDNRNVQYWSDDISSDKDYNELLYFPELNYSIVGDKGNAITGYMRLTDSSAAIFKGRSANEPTIYYMTGNLQSSYDSNGNLSYAIDVFSIKSGSVGETIINRNSTSNLAEDNLILTENGVFGLVLNNSNVTVTERYVRERSRLINGRLLSGQYNLEKACAIEYNNRYYLAVGGEENGCFIADARYKTSVDDDIDGSYNYEWWYWDNIPAKKFYEIDGKLIFTNNNGSLYIFDNEKTDREHLHVEDNIFTIASDESGTIAFTRESEDIANASNISFNCNLVLDSEEIIEAGIMLNCKIEGDRLRLYRINERGEEERLKVKSFSGDTLKGDIINNMPIVAEWYTPYLNFGSAMQSKTMYRMTLTAERRLGKPFSFGYVIKGRNESLVSDGFNLSEENYNDLGYDYKFGQSFTIYKKERDFNYISFKFISDEAGDCVINELTVVYDYHSDNRGIK